MTMRTAYDREHDRELLKHEPRPGDPQPGQVYPMRDLSPPSVLAIETALAVRNPDLKLTQAAQLIEQFAQTEAARIRLEAVAAGAHP